MSTDSTANETKFTPGPWKQNDFLDLKEISLKAIACERLGFCVTFINTADQARVAEAEANARLISAAPELLKALQRLIDASSNCGESGWCGDGESAWDYSRAAIAKALGGAA